MRDKIEAAERRITLTVGVPVAAVALFMGKKTDEAKAEKPRLRDRLYMPERSKNYVKVPIEEMDMLVAMAKRYDAEVDRKMTRKYGKL